MAFPKHGRHGQRGISTPVIIFGSIFAAFLMIGVWVYTSPAPIEEAIENTTITTQFVGKPRIEVTEDTRTRISSEHESEEESKEFEVEKREDDNDTDIEEKLEETEVRDEPEKREIDDAPEVDESTILDKSMEEAKAEEAKAEEARGAAAEVKSEEGVTVVKEDAQPDDEPGESKLEVAENDEVIEEKTDPANAEDLPPVDTTESEDTPGTEEVSTSSWKSQVSKSTEEKEVTKFEPEMLSTEIAVPEETESATQTEEEKKIEESQKAATTSIVIQEEVAKRQVEKYKWKQCNWSGSQDYIPCLDNKKWLATHRQRKHYEHRERHCPTPAELPKCLVPLPPGYKQHIKWPESRSEVCLTLDLFFLRFFQPEYLVNRCELLVVQHRRSGFNFYCGDFCRRGMITCLMLALPNTRKIRTG